MRKKAFESNLMKEKSEEHQPVDLPKTPSKGNSNVASIEAKDNLLSINDKNVSFSASRFPTFPLHYSQKNREKGINAPTEAAKASH